VGAWRRGRCRCSGARAEACAWAALLLAAAAGAAATVGHDALSAVVRARVARLALVDSPAAPHYGAFVDSEDADAGKLFADYTFFNLTNAAAVAAGAKPRFDLVGPVSFRYHSLKFDVQFDALGSSAQYRLYAWYEPATPADAALARAPIVSADLVLLAALNANQPLSGTVPDLYPQSLAPGALFLTRPASDWLFGFDHPYLPDPAAPLSGRMARFPGVATNDSSVAAAAAAHSPSRVATGAGADAGATMAFLAYDGATTTTCCRAGLAGEAGAAASGNCGPPFGTYEGDAVRGNVGTQFHPLVDPGETLLLSTNDFGMYRAWPMVCAGGSALGPGWLDDASDLTARIGGCDAYDVRGVRLNRYSLPREALGNASVSAAEAAAFNITGPSGVLNQTSCEQYAPVFISRPFFLYGSDSLRDALEPLPVTPTEAAHGSFMGVEPVSGRVLDFAFRAQINALLRPTSVVGLGGQVFNYFSGVAPAHVPLLWGEQHARLTPDQAAVFTGELYVGLRVLAGVRWAGAALAVAAALGALVLRARVVPRCRRHDAADEAEAAAAAAAGGGEAEDDAGYAIQ